MEKARVVSSGPLLFTSNLPKPNLRHLRVTRNPLFEKKLRMSHFFCSKTCGIRNLHLLLQCNFKIKSL